MPGAHNLEVQIYRGFWLVSWSIREFAGAEEEVAARGAIVGFRSEHGRAHEYRALLEGLPIMDR